MKKILLLVLIASTLLIGCTNQASDEEITKMKDKINEILKDNEKLHDQIQELEDRFVIYESEETERNTGEIIYYICKLKDKDFTRPYGHEEEPYTWYIAAEELGIIGKSAIPYLIKNLQTNDVYEKGLTLYALLLASQSDSVDEFTNGDYLEAGLTFSPEKQKEYVEIAEEWWGKYKEHFE